MNDKILIYPRGAIIVFTSGEYSDFGIVGLVVAIQDCNLPELAQKMANGKVQYVDSDADSDNFAAWLIANGYAMPVDHSTVHVGDYSDWNKNFGVKLKDD